MSLQALKEELATEIYGMAAADAIDRKICIQCKQPVRKCTRKECSSSGIYSRAGEMEYAMSGLCEYCFDHIFPNQ